MGKGKIKKLVNKAHKIFNKTLVFEVVDMDNDAATGFLSEAYDYPEPEKIEQYLKITAKLR